MIVYNYTWIVKQKCHHLSFFRIFYIIRHNEAGNSARFTHPSRLKKIKEAAIMECCNNSNNLIFLIILLSLFSGEGCGNCGNNNGIWLILLLLLFGCGCNGGSALNSLTGSGCGCNACR
jgi:hypothetical protein